jgi:hypothetical protein
MNQRLGEENEKIENKILKYLEWKYLPESWFSMYLWERKNEIGLLKFEFSTSQIDYLKKIISDDFLQERPYNLKEFLGRIQFLKNSSKCFRFGFQTKQNFGFMAQRS